MKKKLVALFLLAALLLSACAKPAPAEPVPTDITATEQASMPGMDAQNGFGMPGFSFQKIGSNYCGSNALGSYLYYYDTATGTSGPLCAKPDCAHDTKDCFAYTGQGASLSYYDGKLYWVGQSNDSSTSDKALWSSNTDGSDRQQIKVISMQDVILAYQPQQYFIHRGNLFFLGQNNTVSSGEAKIQYTLGYAPLDDSADFTILYDEATADVTFLTVRFQGNSVYLCVNQSVYEESLHHTLATKLTITEYDIPTGTATEIFAETDLADLYDEFWVTEQGTIYLPGLRGDQGYIWEIKDGEKTEVLTFDAASSTPIPVENFAYLIQMKGNTRCITVKDYSGQTLYDGPLYPQGVPGVPGNPGADSDDPTKDYGYAVIGSDGTQLFFNHTCFGGNEIQSYTVMVDVADNMKATLLWSGTD